MPRSWWFGWSWFALLRDTQHASVVSSWQVEGESNKECEMEQETWGKQCPECSEVVPRWERLGGAVPIKIEVMSQGARDAHTLEEDQGIGATAYVCGSCGAEVDAGSWEYLS